MNNALWGLKNDKERLPFSFPGQVSYQDFTEERFKFYDSRIFIRPVLYMEARLPLQTEAFCLPGIKNSSFLLFIEEGRGQFECEGKNFDLAAGSGLLAFTDRPSYLKCKKDQLTCHLFFFTGDLLKELYMVQGKTCICFNKYQYPDFGERFGSLLGEYIKEESPLLFDFSRHMDHLLSRIIHQSVRETFDKTKARKQSLMHALTYMKEHCCEQIQVADIAAVFGYSNSHFSRIFQAEFHQSPKKYLLGLRIAHAQKLLETSDLSVEAIGQECGFSTTTHFIQSFRDSHDMTPLQYRKQIGS